MGDLEEWWVAVLVTGSHGIDVVDVTRLLGLLSST
jgi:hypothetical protein